jgi:AraC-like DNA-binding protein
MTVSILMVRALVQALEQVGVSRSQLFAAVSVDPHWLGDCHARLSDAEYERMQLAALELSGDPALGLHMGEQARASTYDVLGHLTEHATTLRQAIETLARYSRILSDAHECVLHEDDQTASIRYTLSANREQQSGRMSVELTLSALSRMIRAFVGPHASARRVYFEYDAPAYSLEYRRIFSGNECFGQSFNAIEFERGWLDSAQLHQSPELYHALQALAERTLGLFTRTVAFAELVTQHLLRCDRARMPNMNDVARHFEISERSLRRRLQEEGIAYNELVERARTKIAQRMLEQSRSSIHEIAYAMGFATPAAFHRAFKRWTGMTPSVYKASYFATADRGPTAIDSMRIRH